MSEQEERDAERYVTIEYHGREVKVRVPPPISNEGARYYKSILDQAEAMRLRDKGRK